MLGRIPVTVLPDLRADGRVGVTLQPTEDVRRQLSAPGIMFRKRADAKKASDLRYVALYCPYSLDYGRSDGSAIVMQRSVKGQVFAMLRVAGEPVATADLMPWYKDDIVLLDQGETPVSDRWPWSIESLEVYQFNIAPYIEKIIDTKKKMWVYRLFGVAEVDVEAFDGYELVYCGKPADLANGTSLPPTDEQSPELIERSAKRNGVSFEEARRSNTLYALATPLRPNELKVGIGIDTCEKRLTEARRWLGAGAAFVQTYSAHGIAADLEHRVHEALTKRRIHVGGEWFRARPSDLDSVVFELLLPHRRRRA
jgi:hypothetical protein